MVFDKVHFWIFTYNSTLTVYSNNSDSASSQGKLPNVQADDIWAVIMQYMCNQVKCSCKHGNTTMRFHHRRWSVKTQRSNEDTETEG